MIKNYHVIEAKYFGATNTRGSRVKMTSARFSESVTIPYDYSKNRIEDMAIHYLTAHGHNVVGIAEGKESVLIIAAATSGGFVHLRTIKAEAH